MLEKNETGTFRVDYQRKKLQTPLWLAFGVYFHDVKPGSFQEKVQ